MQLSQSTILTTRYLNQVFHKTVATYKYYWFLGFLDLLWVILLKKLLLWIVEAVGLFSRIFALMHRIVLNMEF